MKYLNKKMEATLKQDISLLKILDIRMYNGSQQL